MSIKFDSKMIEKNVLTGLDCDACGEDIPLGEGGGICQGVGMLTVTVSGGYGEYMDGSSRVMPCADCAKLLQDAFPMLWKNEVFVP
jgi:hypothetical protein